MTEARWTPAPMPEHWSDNHKLAVELCARIPAGSWSSYGNLAEAFNVLTGGKHTGFTFGRLINDAPHRRQFGSPEGGRPVYWTVPWHRIRNDKGQMVALMPDGRKVVTDDGEQGNVLFNAEANGAGLLHDGIARSSLFVDMHQELAAGEISV